ncbi:MAG: LolA family protein [Haliscomenobacter sp.]
MRTVLITWLAYLSVVSANAQGNPKQLLQAVNRKFAQVSDYSANLNMQFNIPSVALEPVSGKVYYKAPDKFRIKATGILFMPRQNPYYTLQSIRDTNAYTAVFAGQEQVGTVRTTVINVIPYDNAGELILARLWIDPARQLILKSQLTTKTNGTILVEQFYGAMQQKGLPDRIRFSIDVARFKVPKTVAIDLNSKSKNQSLPAKGTGIIELSFSGYTLNQKLSDSVFREEAQGN